MSDNLILTVLGAVGVGALLMSMKENNVKEDFLMAHLPKVNTQLADDGSGCVQSENFSVRPLFQKAVKQAMALQQQGVPQSQIMSTLSNTNQQIRNERLSTLSKGVNSSIASATMPTKENYQNSSPSLGSSAVTTNDYVSYPGFDQTMPERSPSLNLGRNINYSPTSLNNMGITEAYQSRVQKPLQSAMDYSNVVEGFSTAPPPQSMKATGLPTPGYTAGNFKDAMNKGNDLSQKQGSKFISESAMLPIASMDSANGQNVVLFDRPMYSGTRTGGWRQGGRGDSDLIRGDLAVCVDPCQKGWFQSSLGPANLRTGALQQIAGSSEAGMNVGAMAKVYGQISPAAMNSTATPQYTANQMALISTASGSVVQTTAFS
jgi:hypothetical protein